MRDPAASGKINSMKPKHKARYPTSAEEENLSLEVLEDSRLRGLGIDPDGDSVDIMFELFRRMEALEAEFAQSIPDESA